MMQRGTDIPDGSRFDAPSGGGGRNEPPRAQWTRPTVLIPEDPGYDAPLYPYEEQHRRSRTRWVLVVAACLIVGAMLLVLSARDRVVVHQPGMITASGEVETPPPLAPHPDEPAAVASRPSWAELRIGGTLPESAVVTVNGRLVVSQRVTLDSGSYEVRVHVPGYRDVSDEIRLAAGTVTVWTPQLVPLSSREDRAAAPHRAHPQPPPASKARTTVRVATSIPRPDDPVPEDAGAKRGAARARSMEVAPSPAVGAPSGPAPTVASRATVESSAAARSCTIAYGERDWAAAFTACGEAARAGNPAAQWSLGMLYHDGLGVSRDDERAAHWLQRAADGGSRDAQYRLGRLYQSGRGVRRSDAVAAYWFRLAALRGDVDAQLQLALAYERGVGVAADPGKAKLWFRKAAEQGNVWAQNHLGWMYANGRGTAVDYGQGAHWFRMAAEQGNAQAQYNLGHMYLNGLGVQRSVDSAVVWFRKAADQGNAEARQALDLLFAYR